MPTMITPGYDKFGRDVDAIIRLFRRPAFGQHKVLARNGAGEGNRWFGSVDSQKIFERAAYITALYEVKPFLCLGDRRQVSAEEAGLTLADPAVLVTAAGTQVGYVVGIAPPPLGAGAT